MARRRRVRGKSGRAAADDDPPIDVAVIGQGVGNFETINGMPQGIVGAALVVLAIIFVRPIIRVVKAVLRR